MNIGTCPVCGRGFIASTCETHCGPVCCRGDKEPCPNVRPDVRASRYIGRHNKRCVVCGARGEDFKRFAPCTHNHYHKDPDQPTCKYYRYPDYFDGLKHLGTVYICWGQVGDGIRSQEEMEALFHRPTEKPRYHIKYCSLACYNNPEFGHYQKVQKRWRRKWNRQGIYQRNRRIELREHGPNAKFY